MLQEPHRRFRPETAAKPGGFPTSEDGHSPTHLFPASQRSEAVSAALRAFPLRSGSEGKLCSIREALGVNEVLCHIPIN